MLRIPPITSTKGDIQRSITIPNSAGTPPISSQLIANSTKDFSCEIPPRASTASLSPLAEERDFVQRSSRCHFGLPFLRHFGKELLSIRGDLFFREVLLVRCKRPLMAEGIFNLAE